MDTLDDAKARATATYNAVADCYDNPANAFWDRFGRRTIERLQLPPGARVLDACCGSGASAIPAAEQVGLEGLVLGIDLAENLLRLARAKANDRGLRNIEFRTGDVLDLAVPEAPFDAVVGVFGIFFVPDMAAAVSELWRVVRPGGRLAITTWGPNFFEPAAGGVEQAEVIAEPGTHPVPSPDVWWSAVLGSGYRGTLEQLDAGARDRVRMANLDIIRRSAIRSVEANVVYAVATKSR